MLNIFNPKEMLVKEGVKAKIRNIAKGANIEPSKVYATIVMNDKGNDFHIWLYSKDDLTVPIREVKLSELI